MRRNKDGSISDRGKRFTLVQQNGTKTLQNDKAKSMLKTGSIKHYRIIKERGGYSLYARS